MQVLLIWLRRRRGLRGRRIGAALRAVSALNSQIDIALLRSGPGLSAATTAAPTELAGRAIFKRHRRVNHLAATADL